MEKVSKAWSFHTGILWEKCQRHGHFTRLFGNWKPRISRCSSSTNLCTPHTCVVYPILPHSLLLFRKCVQWIVARILWVLRVAGRFVSFLGTERVCSRLIALDIPGVIFIWHLTVVFNFPSLSNHDQCAGTRELSHLSNGVGWQCTQGRNCRMGRLVSA